MPKIFRGWVPTVSGFLSFGTVGNSTYPSPARQSNVEDDSHRFLACYQKRVQTDALIPAPFWARGALSRLLTGDESRIFFVCVAQASNIPCSHGSSLKGCIFAVFGPKNWRAGTRDTVERYMGKLEEWRSLRHSSGLQQHIEKDFLEVCESLKTQCHFYCDFELPRNGLCTITPPHDPLFPWGDIDPSKTSKKDDSIRELVAQSYFFLRDIVHTHQHHPPNADKIITVYPVNSSENNEWIAKIQNSLFRKAIEFKRTRTAERCTSALGILAYLRTLNKVSADCFEKSNLMPAICDDNLEVSMQTTLQELAAERDWYRYRRNIILTTIFGIIGLVIATSGVVAIFGAEQEVISRAKSLDSKVVSLLAVFSSAPLSFSISIIVVFYAVSFAVRRKLGKFGPYRYLLTLFSPLSQSAAAAWLFAIGVIVFLIFYLLIVSGVPAFLSDYFWCIISDLP